MEILGLIFFLFPSADSGFRLPLWRTRSRRWRRRRRRRRRRRTKEAAVYVTCRSLPTFPGEMLLPSCWLGSSPPAAILAAEGRGGGGGACFKRAGRGQDGWNEKCTGKPSWFSLRQRRAWPLPPHPQLYFLLTFIYIKIFPPSLHPSLPPSLSLYLPLSFTYFIYLFFFFLYS